MLLRLGVTFHIITLNMKRPEGVVVSRPYKAYISQLGSMHVSVANAQWHKGGRGLASLTGSWWSVKLTCHNARRRLASPRTTAAQAEPCWDVQLTENTGRGKGVVNTASLRRLVGGEVYQDVPLQAE